MYAKMYQWARRNSKPVRRAFLSRTKEEHQRAIDAAKAKRVMRAEKTARNAILQQAGIANAKFELGIHHNLDV